MVSNIHQVDRDNPTPLYEQIRLILRQQILSGEYSPGDQLPSGAELCNVFKVSRITVTRSLNELERSGLIQRIQGKGSLVVNRQVAGSFEKITGFSENLRRQGHVPGTRMLGIELVEGDFQLKHTFNLPIHTPEKFFKIRRLRLVDQTPAVILTTYVRKELGIRMQAYDLASASFYRLYEEILGKRIIRNEASVSPVLATAEEIELLRVKPGSAHLFFRGLSFVEGEIPVELAMGVYHGDIFQFAANIYRTREEVTGTEMQMVLSNQTQETEDSIWRR
jgi:GntR family transcriptional regulator